MVTVGHDGELNILDNITILIRLNLIRFASCSTAYKFIHLCSNSIINIKTRDSLEEDVILVLVPEEELDVGKESQDVVAVIWVLTDVLSTEVEHKHDILNPGTLTS